MTQRAAVLLFILVVILAGNARGTTNESILKEVTPAKASDFTLVGVWEKESRSYDDPRITGKGILTLQRIGERIEGSSISIVTDGSREERRELYVVADSAEFPKIRLNFYVRKGETRARTIEELEVKSSGAMGGTGKRVGIDDRSYWVSYTRKW